MNPLQPPHRDVFKHTQPLMVEGQPCRIPSLEMAIVMKFAPMISLYRADKDKFQDAHDFLAMVEVNAEIDLEKLSNSGPGLSKRRCGGEWNWSAEPERGRN